MAGFRYKASATVAPGTTSATAALGEGNLVLMTNVGTVNVFVLMGQDAATATANSLAIAPGTSVVLMRDAAQNLVAHITAAGTGSLNIATGYWGR